MTLSAFDTHSLIKRLTEAGMPEPQAEVIADAQRQLIDERLATRQDIEQLRLATRQDIEQLRLATRQDIEQLRLATEQNIEQMRLEFKADMAELKTSMFRWSAVLTGVTIGTIGLIMTLVH